MPKGRFVLRTSAGFEKPFSSSLYKEIDAPKIGYMRVFNLQNKHSYGSFEFAKRLYKCFHNGKFAYRTPWLYVRRYEKDAFRAFRKGCLSGTNFNAERSLYSKVVKDFVEAKFNRLVTTGFTEFPHLGQVCLSVPSELVYRTNPKLEKRRSNRKKLYNSRFFNNDPDTSHVVFPRSYFSKITNPLISYLFPFSLGKMLMKIVNRNVHSSNPPLLFVQDIPYNKEYDEFKKSKIKKTRKYTDCF